MILRWDFMVRPDLQVMGRTVPRIRPKGVGKFHLKVRSLTTLAAKEPKASKVGASDKLDFNTVSGSRCSCRDLF